MNPGHRLLSPRLTAGLARVQRSSMDALETSFHTRERRRSAVRLLHLGLGLLIRLGRPHLTARVHAWGPGGEAANGSRIR